MIIISLSSTGSSQNQLNQNSLSSQFCTNGRLNENSFKIALKPQNTLKQASQNQTTTSIGSIPSTVTSTNPKTPSPRTHDVRPPHANPSVDTL